MSLFGLKSLVSGGDTVDIKMIHYLFNSMESLISIILFTAFFSIWIQKFKIFKFFGPGMTAIIIGGFLSNCRIVPNTHSLYYNIILYSTPVITSLYLLKIDISEIKKVTFEPFLAMISSFLCISISSLISGIIFSKYIPDCWKVVGMFAGTNVGGTPNLTAIAVGLKVSQNNIAVINTADYIISIPIMLILFSAPMLLAKCGWFQKKWPYHFSHIEYYSEPRQPDIKNKTVKILDMTILLALSFCIITISNKFSKFLLPGSFQGTGKILLLSTISFVFAQLPIVKKLECQYDLGFLLSIIFLVVIGFSIDIKHFLNTTFIITFLGIIIVLLSIVLHVSLLRFLKIKYEYMILSLSTSLIDGPSAALIVSNCGWQNLIGLAIIMGAISALVANYVGFGIAYAIKFLINIFS